MLYESNKAKPYNLFAWGAASAAFQVEGGWDAEGKGLSIWDTYTARKGNIFRGHDAKVACDFYHLYAFDLKLMRAMGIQHYRFSISWPRIVPDGTGKVNQAGLAFYDRVIDLCLELGITPWVTLYHWDLPEALQQKGGWTNRRILQWFEDYVTVVVKHFGDRVKNWMVLNEPMVFTGAGYFLGVHAPGKKGLKQFLPAMHHATMCQAIGGYVIRTHVKDAHIGTTFSCSYIEPWKQEKRHIKAAQRVDALLNRLFVEPALGMWYPLDQLPALGGVEKYVHPNDDVDIVFDFDFIGVQNYTREVVRHSWFTPLIHARLLNARKRGVPTTTMKWEVYTESLYHMLHQFAAYEGVNNVIVTENGASFPDRVVQDRVNDHERMITIKAFIKQMQRAQKEGVPVSGYFVWSFTDNFEWSEGYYPRFGLVYVDYDTQERIIKKSGEWYSNMIRGI